MWEALITPWALLNHLVAIVAYLLTCKRLYKSRRILLNLKQRIWLAFGLVVSACTTAVCVVFVGLVGLALNDFGYSGPGWIFLPLLILPGVVGGFATAGGFALVARVGHGRHGQETASE